eukprot:SAG22_NODE_306_length_12671_cov_14.743239_14_plen_222_part_00
MIRCFCRLRLPCCACCVCWLRADSKTTPSPPLLTRTLAPRSPANSDGPVFVSWSGSNTTHFTTHYHKHTQKQLLNPAGLRSVKVGGRLAQASRGLIVAYMLKSVAFFLQTAHMVGAALRQSRSWRGMACRRPAPLRRGRPLNHRAHAKTHNYTHAHALTRTHTRYGTAMHRTAPQGDMPYVCRLTSDVLIGFLGVGTSLFDLRLLFTLDPAHFDDPGVFIL